MALFTDGPVSTVEDLTARDTQLDNVASVEGIDVTQKLILAQEELGLELHDLLEASRRADGAFWPAPRPTVKNVAATPALRLWHTYRTLEMVYRDAYANQRNDRYAAKRDQFEERAKWAYEKVLRGIGMVWTPVPRAAAPTVTPAGGSLPDGTYYAATAWTNGKGEEGAASAASALTTVGSTLLVQAGAAPAVATGWNVYVGTDPGALTRQNGQPIGVTQSWLQPNALAAGSGPGWGQEPDYLMAAPRMILRG